jgi:hypothetical protein
MQEHVPEAWGGIVSHAPERLFASQREGPIHLVIDSTGLKIVGDGEWHAYKHRSSNKRRSWRRLHLAVCDGGLIEASELTDSGADDAVVGEALLGKIVKPVASFRGDGAYDTRAFYAALGRAGTPDIDIVIPPRRKASPSRPVGGTWQQRSEAIGGNRAAHVVKPGPVPCGPASPLGEASHAVHQQVDHAVDGAGLASPADPADQREHGPGPLDAVVPGVGGPEIEQAGRVGPLDQLLGEEVAQGPAGGSVRSGQAPPVEPGIASGRAVQVLEQGSVLEGFPLADGPKPELFEGLDDGHGPGPPQPDDDEIHARARPWSVPLEGGLGFAIGPEAQGVVQHGLDQGQTPGLISTPAVHHEARDAGGLVADGSTEQLCHQRGHLAECSFWTAGSESVDCGQPRA